MILLGSSGLTLFCLVGVQILVSIFLLSFVVVNPSLSMRKSEAADVDSIFWTVFTITRAISVFVATVATPVQVTFGCLMLLTTMSTLLAIFPDFGLDVTRSRVVFQVTSEINNL
jgi:fucose permease